MKELKKHLYTLEIPKYITQVKTAEKKMSKYYSSIAGRSRVKKLPVRLEKKGHVKTDKFGFYLDENGERIVANTKTVGKPNLFNINSQILYVGRPWQRVAMKNTLEEFFLPILEQVPIFTGSIIMESEIHTVVGSKQADLDNVGYIYGKVLTDTLVNTGKLFDDSVPYVTKPCSSPLFFPVDTLDERKMVYHFYQDLRPEILKLHKN